MVGQSVVDNKVERLAGSQALRLRQAREQRQGFVGRTGRLAGWLEWPNGWYGPMLCQVQISHSSPTRCEMSPHAHTPDQRWAPMTTTPSPQAQIEQRI